MSDGGSMMSIGHGSDDRTSTPDGGHGPACYDVAGRVICSWPERHDADFIDPKPPRIRRLATRWRPIGRGLDHALTAAIVVVGLAVVLLGILIPAKHLHFQTVTSGSMRPTASPGDVAVTQAVPASSLVVGDVIVFMPPGRVGEPVMHRIVSIDEGVIQTRGDANAVNDAWQIHLGGDTAYRMVAVIPFIGWLGELQRPALILAGLLVLLLVGIEFWKEVKGLAARVRSRRQV